MLATILFIAFWVILGLAIFLIAVRGGPTAPARNMRGGRTSGLVFLFIYVGFGVAMPAIFLVGNHSNASAQVRGVKLTAAEKRGRELFGANCAVCHTLSAANAYGAVGPNLDTLRPPASLVANTIANGCVQNPPANNPALGCLGYGTMPSQLLEGQDAQDVAAFVAKVTHG